MTISQKAVFEEVARTASYNGAKMEGDGNAYSRMTVVDEDHPELQRFWDESRAEVAQTFIRMLASEGMGADGDTYSLVLNVSESFDPALLPGMRLGLYSYFVQSIVGRWYVYSNKAEAGATVDRGSALLEEVKEKAFFKKKPVRPTYD